MEGYPLDRIRQMFETNTLGALRVIQAVLPAWRKRGSGVIVNVSSVSGRVASPLEAAYCASKFAQVGLTAALDHELREQGVRCTNVCPGGVATDFAMGRGRTPDMPALKGMMAAGDVADAVLFVVTRPRGHRILELAMRPVSETSWG